ncbi:glycosyltransferase family 2 protein [Sphingomonas sp. ID0503]|uniref:glycosyltransferase family 2 protein n=1 Tax=Sphingomonas sp. ID0503 TaxID=3399691 RepID=UPI003AFB6B0C
MTIPAIILTIVLAPLWLLTGVFVIEVVLGLAPQDKRRRAFYRRPASFTVLIPAHNEAEGIGAMLNALALAEPHGRRLVVADNCTDDTADIARAAGAEVIERHDPTRRGKGWALAFGRDHLLGSERPPEVVVVLDADCTVEPGALQRVADTAFTRRCVAQAAYMFRPRRRASPMVQISSFAMLVKNLIRQRGGFRLGAPAALTGSGMAFPWAIFAAAPLASGHIVEDLCLGLDLLRAGKRIRFEGRAQVWSEPSGQAGTEVQRSRWEAGFMGVAATQGLPLLAFGLTRLRWPVIWQALHVMTPPLALLLVLDALGLGAAAGLRAFDGSDLPLTISLVLTGLAILAVLAAWVTSGRAYLSSGTLLRIPFYILWKLLLYVRIMTGRLAPSWTRTERVDP